VAQEHRPDAEEVRALIAPFMDGHVDAGAFFRVAGGRGRGVWGLLLWGPRQLARERQAGLGTFTYLAVLGPEVAAFELRWDPLRVHRTFGHWPITALETERTSGHAARITLDGKRVDVEAAVPGADAAEVLRRLSER
jgi:hypothetical protein